MRRWKRCPWWRLPMHKTPRLLEHGRRVEFLKTLAQPAGYSVRLRCLPGSFMPDVLLFAPQSCGLFIGDAKNTETPFSAPTSDSFITCASGQSSAKTRLPWCICRLFRQLRATRLVAAYSLYSTVEAGIHIPCY